MPWPFPEISREKTTKYLRIGRSWLSISTNQDLSVLKWCEPTLLVDQNHRLFQVTNVDWQQLRTSQRALELAEEATGWVVQRHVRHLLTIASKGGILVLSSGEPETNLYSYYVEIKNRIMPAVTRSFPWSCQEKSLAAKNFTWWATPDPCLRISLIKALYVLGYLMLVRLRWKSLSVSEMRDSDVPTQTHLYFWLLFHDQTWSNQLVSIQQEKHTTSFVKPSISLKLGCLACYSSSEIFASLEVNRSNYPHLTGGWHAWRGAVSPMPREGGSFVELFLGSWKVKSFLKFKNNCIWRTPK